MNRYLIAFLLLATPVAAQTTFYTAPNGMPAGSADRYGDITFYTAPDGMPAGSSMKFGNQKYYNNADGTPAGSSMTFGDDGDK